MKLRDVLRRISERFLSRSHSLGSNAVKPQPQDQAPSPPADETAPPVQEDWGDNPIFVRSQEAFYRDLADLLKKHEGKWAAYHGDECVGTASTLNEVWERCLCRGLKPGEFAVLYVHNFALDNHAGELWDEGGEINGEAVPEPPPH